MCFRCAPQYVFPISLTHQRPLCTSLLKEMARNEGAGPFIPRIASWEAGSDWLNLEPLALDNPRPVHFFKFHYYFIIIIFLSHL